MTKFAELIQFLQDPKLVGSELSEEKMYFIEISIYA